MLFYEDLKLFFCFHRVLLVLRDPPEKMVLLVRG